MPAAPAFDRPYVFLSYASSERERALAVADALEAVGVPVWVDRTSIHGGASWGKEIVEGIRNCSALLIACTTAAMHSRNIRQEIQLGWRYEKPYLPLLLDAIEFPTDILYFLEGYQWVELLDRPPGEWLPVLLKALNRFGVSTGEPHSRGPLLASAAVQSPNTADPQHTDRHEPPSDPATRDAGAPSSGPAAGVQPSGAATRAQPSGMATGAPFPNEDAVSTGASEPWRSAPPGASIAPLHDGEARGGTLPANMPFIGREHELEAAQRALGEALAGRGRLLMLAGEPGIGKTRLAQRVADEARERGAQVLWGRCWEGDGAPSYFPWAEVVRGYLREVESGTAAAELSAGAGEIAQIVPDLHAFLPDIPPLPQLDPEDARFRLYNAVSAWLRTTAARRPLVLVLDDLHWADKPSLLLLQFLARDLPSLPVLVLGAYRDVELDRKHPLSETLAALRREPVFERLLLHGLSEPETEALVSAAGQQELQAPGKVFAAALHRETEGNPFFLQETLRHLVESGKLVQRGGRWTATATLAELGIPEGVREVLGRRLSRLSEGCNTVLAIAAVIGREFAVSTLERVSGKSEDEIFEALEEAEAARVIVEAGTAGRYRFAHALVRETLYAELTTLRRVRLHRRVAETLEQQYARNPAPHLAELAYHFLEAAAGGDVSKAVAYVRRAGDYALAQLAYEEAACHYERALQTLDQAEEPDAELECELLLASADARMLTGDRAQSADAALRAAALARGLHDRERLARAAIRHSRVAFVPWQTGAECVALLEEALAAIGEDDSSLRAQLLACLAVSTYYSDQAERRHTLIEEAVAMARRGGDQAGLCAVLGDAAMATRGAEALAEQEALAKELIVLAERIGASEHSVRAYQGLSATSLRRGDVPGFQATVEALAVKAVELHYPWRWKLFLSMMRATLPLLQGRYEEAARLAAEGLDVLARSGVPTGGWNMQHQILHVTAQTGEPALIARDAEAGLRNADALPYAPIFRAAYTPRLARLGRLEEAQREFEKLAPGDFAILRRDPGDRVVSLALLAEACWYLGDRERAAVLYEQLVLYSDQQIIYSGGHVAFGSCHRYLGMLAATLERWDEARAHFAAAIPFEERMEARPWLAHTRFAYGCMLLACDQGGDREQAAALLAQALATARELGMKPLVAEVARRLKNARLSA